jgi:aminoglycoside phosphotransferase (APT) family kinase protein
MDTPGRLVASGRDSDIYEYGQGRVLRRAKEKRSMDWEARTMEYARSAGYPVPQVFELSDDGTDLVMERIEGRSMLDAIESAPWRLPRYAAMLADLHDRLHAIAAPDWVRDAAGGAGESLLHLDLHPLNVIVSPSGPVVIDWANASRGRPGADVAASWLLMASAEIPGNRLKARALGVFRSALVRSFLSHFDLKPVKAELAAITEWKCRDAHMNAAERGRMWALARANSPT